MNFLFLGPQGSGKGTQAHLLKERMNLNYFDMGSFLRKMAESHEELKAKLAAGEMLPDELTNTLIQKHLEENQMYDNIIFDGYPRRIGQLMFLQSLLSQNGTRLDYTVYLTLPEEETIRRLSARRIHKVTGEIYNLITNPPGDNIDPNDLLHRADDQPEAIKQRLLTYHAETEPMIEELRKTTNFIEIDGTQDIETIHADIWDKLHTQE